MERRLRCGMTHAALFSCGSASPPHPSFRPILYHSGQFSGILGQKVWVAGIVFILLPSIFRTPQCGQYKPNQYVMKKIFLLLAAAAAASGAYAEGYQVNNLSSKQNGMGHVGTAMKLNSESIWFNPAAASFQDSEFDISVGITGIASKATYTSLPRLYGQDQTAALHLGQQHSHSALRLLQLQTPRLDVGRSGLQHAVRLLDGLGQQLAGSAARAVDQSQGIQRPADRLVQTLRAPLRRRRSDDDLG